MLREGEIIVGDVRQAGIDDPLSNIWLRDRRESSARRTFEIGEFEDFHRGIGLAHEIALRRSGGSRVDCDRCRSDWRTGVRFASRGPAQYACADNEDDAENYISPFWPA